MKLHSLFNTSNQPVTLEHGFLVHSGLAASKVAHNDSTALMHAESYQRAVMASHTNHAGLYLATFETDSGLQVEIVQHIMGLESAIHTTRGRRAAGFYWVNKDRYSKAPQKHAIWA